MSKIDYLTIYDLPIHCPLCGTELSRMESARFFDGEWKAWKCKGCNTDWSVQALIDALNYDEDTHPDGYWNSP